MREIIVRSVVTPTITAGAYTTGKALGGLLTFANLANGGSSIIHSAILTDLAAQDIAIELMLFNASITATADAATLAISAADVIKSIGVISFGTGDYIKSAATTNGIATKSGLILPAISTADNNIYGQLVARGSATYVSTADITVQLFARTWRE